MRTRVLIAVPGVLLGLYGVFRLLTEIDTDDLLLLAVWLVAAVVLHDAVLSPVLVGLGWLVGRVVPARARRFVQGGLIAASLVTVIALPLIHRQGSQPASKGILRQDYTRNLALALAIVLAVVVVGYLAAVARGQRPRTANVRPDDDQDSTSE